MNRINSVLMFLVLFLAACTHPDIQKDAKKMADLECRSKELMKKAQQGDLTGIDDSIDLSRELDSLNAVVNKKYVKEKDKVKFAEELLKALATCP